MTYFLSAQVPKPWLRIFLEDMLRFKQKIWEPDSQIAGWDLYCTNSVACWSQESLCILKIYEDLGERKQEERGTFGSTELSEFIIFE